MCNTTLLFAVSLSTVQLPLSACAMNTTSMSDALCIHHDMQRILAGCTRHVCGLSNLHAFLWRGYCIWVRTVDMLAHFTAIIGSSDHVVALPLQHRGVAFLYLTCHTSVHNRRYKRHLPKSNVTGAMVWAGSAAVMAVGFYFVIEGRKQRACVESFASSVPSPLTEYPIPRVCFKTSVA